MFAIYTFSVTLNVGFSEDGLPFSLISIVAFLCSLEMFFNAASISSSYRGLEMPFQLSGPSSLLGSVILISSQFCCVMFVFT